MESIAAAWLNCITISLNLTKKDKKKKKKKKKKTLYHLDVTNNTANGPIKGGKEGVKVSLGVSFKDNLIPIFSFCELNSQ